MPRDWNLLSDEQQLVLSGAALRRAIQTLVGQAEGLADEFDSGLLPDQGGAEALRLLASLMREMGRQGSAAAGHA